MPLNIKRALRDGFDRMLEPNAAMIVTLLFALQMIRTVVQESLILRFAIEVLDYEQLLADLRANADRPVPDFVGNNTPLAVLDLPVSTLLGILLVLVVVWLAIRIGIVRTFTSEETASLPIENFTDRLGWTLVNLIVGTVIYAVAVVIGLVLVLPGLYVAIALFFYNFEIIVEGKNAIAALEGSWDLTAGNRLPLFALGALFFLLEWIAGLIVPSTTIAATALSTAVTIIVSVFGIAVAAQVYNQLRGATDPYEPADPEGTL